MNDPKADSGLFDDLSNKGSVCVKRPELATKSQYLAILANAMTL